MNKRPSAFTLLELLIVISIIIILAGLILATAGYVQKKGARSRAEAEIAAMSAALESYKADNGIYPTNTDTEGLAANRDFNSASTNYEKTSLFLYKQISGDTNATRAGTGKSYMNFDPGMLKPAPPSTASVTAIRDPFGNSYGYSTIKAKTPAGSDGYNPTFDLWSTAGTMGTTASDQQQWIKNW